VQADKRNFNGGAIVSPGNKSPAKSRAFRFRPAAAGRRHFHPHPGRHVGEREQQPLFIIDGVPIDNEGVASGRTLNFLNPND
jgi:iron complex outermembrane receptor protein